MLGGGGGGVNKMRGGVEPIQHGNWMRLGKGLVSDETWGVVGPPPRPPGCPVRGRGGELFCCRNSPA